MKKRSGRKEKSIMIASSVLVLSALTITGVYVRNGRGEKQDGGYTIDFSSLEDGKSSKIAGEDIPVTDSDLDYDPASTEAGSSTVKNKYGKSGKTANGGASLDEKAEAIRLKEASSDLVVGEGKTKDGVDESAEAMAELGGSESTEAMAELPAEGEVTEASSEAVAAQIQPELTFSEADSLVMPFAGNILINYSADKSVYFPTLQQYKCSTALVLSATPGESVKAAAPGMVSKIYDDPRTGQTVVMSLGNGYELTYGQLQEVSVSEGTYVAEGEIFAEVAEPTRYYAVEGGNLYLKLTKDGIPINPTM